MANLFGMSRVRAMLSETLVGSWNEEFNGFPRIFLGTGDYDGGVIYGWQATNTGISTFGGSVILEGALDVGTRLSTCAAWIFAMNDGGGGPKYLDYSTVAWAGAGSSSSTFAVKWTVGVGSLDTNYPVFVWDNLAEPLCGRLHYTLGNGPQFGGFYGAVVWGNSYVSANVEVYDYDTPAPQAYAIMAKRIYSVTTGTVATVMFRGTANANIQPSKIVLWGSYRGSSMSDPNAFNTNPEWGAIPAPTMIVATFQKYIQDPGAQYSMPALERTDALNNLITSGNILEGGIIGGQWPTLKTGDIWTGTFYFEV